MTLKHPLRSIAVHACLSFFIIAASAEAQSLDRLVPHVLEFAGGQLKATLQAQKDPTRYPRSTNADGTWKTTAATDWTSGFFPGCLWQMYEFTQDTFYRRAAERWTAGLESDQFYRRTHDLGFMINDSYGQGNRLAPNEAYRRVLVQTARTLALRFNPTVGCIRSWDQGAWQYPVIIDNMMNLELLFWASKHGGEPRLAEIAVTHALTTMKTHIREDGSAYHLVDFDTTSGAVIRKQTVQGAFDESAWARGQAWALYGFTAAYRETGDARFLQTAERTADFFIEHLPADTIPYWDFRAPNIPNEERDVSAAAIASSGLLELRTLTKNPGRAAAYRKAAERMLTALCRAPYLAEGTRSMAILNHAVGHKPGHSEIDVSIIYADYYFLEALHRWTQASVSHR